MKKILSGILILFFSSAATATKARLAALNNSQHLLDEQLVFSNPIDLNYVGSLLSIETGTSDASAAATATSNAEAFVSSNWQDKNLGLSIGHQDETVVRTRDFINSFGTTYRHQQNPLNLFFGDETDGANYAVTGFYSAYNNKVIG